MGVNFSLFLAILRFRSPLFQSIVFFLILCTPDLHFCSLTFYIPTRCISFLLCTKCFTPESYFSQFLIMGTCMHTYVCIYSGFLIVLLINKSYASDIRLKPYIDPQSVGERKCSKPYFLPSYVKKARKSF